MKAIDLCQAAHVEEKAHLQLSLDDALFEHKAEQ